ncbi:MAG: hypothetical protein GY856_19995 [bacterium]|nr:hypothetical protein [bacterium]
MIAFVTLFLGLVLGVQEVALEVGDEVAAVEIRLNGDEVATLTGAPWTLRADFGDELVPQELVAIARDAGGEVIGRARQWINLPRRPADVRVVLAGADAGSRVARLSWESLAGAEPLAVRVTLDGLAVPVDDPRAVALPDHDPAQLHFLRAELEFAGGVTSAAEMVFGGTYVDQVSTELTAVPVVGPAGKLFKRGKLAGLLVEDGEALEVVGIEEGPALVLVVPDRHCRAGLEELSRYRFTGPRTLARAAYMLGSFASLHRNQFLQILWPVTRRRGGVRQTYDLFPTSPPYDADQGGVFDLLALGAKSPTPGEQRLADAVAVAGLTAAELGQRRAVVLLVGGEPEDDSSRLEPAQARRYLERLRVPFYVWSLGGNTAGAWGEAKSVTRLSKFRRVVLDLAKQLDRQRIVWVAGVHLPQKIALAPGATDLELLP